MKKIVVFAGLASAALALSACGKKAEEAPAAPATTEAEMMAPAETPAATPAETPAAEPMMTETPAPADDVDPTNNPIGPG